MVLGIDFDGTIRDCGTNEPIEGVKNAINQLREKGNRVLIHSCNDPKFIRKWLEDHDIRFDWIWGESGAEGNKPVCDWYIDDRAINFDTWKHVLDRLLHGA